MTSTYCVAQGTLCFVCVCVYIYNIQLSSVTQWCLTLHDPMDRSPVHHQLLDSTQIHVHWVSDAIQPSRPLSPLLLLPSISPSIKVFSNESVLCIRWLKCWSKLIIWTRALSNSMKLWAMPCRAKTNESWWRVLSKYGSLEKGMSNHFSILALRWPWTV